MRRCEQNSPHFNLKITKDISLTCYDYLEIAKINNSPLTLICIHVTNAGYHLVCLLMEILKDVLSNNSRESGKWKWFIYNQLPLSEKQNG